MLNRGNFLIHRPLVLTNHFGSGIVTSQSGKRPFFKPNVLKATKASKVANAFATSVPFRPFAPFTMNKVTTYFREALYELRKVTWPTRKQTLNYSFIVIAITIATAVFFAALDYIFTWMLGLIV